MKSVLSLVENAPCYGHAQDLGFWSQILRIVKARPYPVMHPEKVPNSFVSQNKTWKCQFSFREGIGTIKCDFKIH